MDITELLERTAAAVRDVGALIVQGIHRPKAVTMKGRVDLVTETDTAVEARLKERLGALVPEAAFLAEESAQDLDPGELCWIIDPLDGTTNFAHGLPMVATSVALWRDGESVIGVVHLPVLDECFTAAKGRGARLNGEPIAVSDTDTLLAGVIATGFPYNAVDHMDEIMAEFHAVAMQVQGMRRFGAAAVDLAYVACGRLDGFYEYGLKPWDTAAGWLLVEEAGGTVGTLQGEPHTLDAPSILASNGRIHGPLQNTVLGALDGPPRYRPPQRSTDG